MIDIALARAKARRESEAQKVRDNVAKRGRIDALIDRLDKLPRGEHETIDGVEVYRIERADPDGWEYHVTGVSFLTSSEVAERIVGR